MNIPVLAAFPRFDHIGPDEGLSHQTVTSGIQDRTGLMWFGTIDGLNCFDGYRCRVFKHDPSRSDSLSSSFIHGIVEDEDGTLWIATRDAGISVLPVEGRATGSFKHLSHHPDQPGSLSNQRVNAVHLDRSGRLWVGTLAGLDLYLPETGGFSNFRFHEAGILSVNSIHEDRSGNLWIATFQGVFKLALSELDDVPAEQAYQMTHWLQGDSEWPTGINTKQISSIFEDRQGYLWFGTRGGGLIRLEPGEGTIQHWRYDANDPDGLAKDNALVSYQDGDGRLWITTDGAGFQILDPSNGVLQRFSHDPNRSESLSHDNVTHVVHSREGVNGTIWLLTWGGGINRLIEEDRPFSLIRPVPGKPNSLSDHFILSLCEDRFGDLWVGTGSGGLNRWQRDRNRWQTFLPNAGEETSLADTNVWAVVEDQVGDLWVATERGGLHQLRRGQRDDAVRFIRHQHDPANPKGIQENNVKTFFEDEAGTRWIGYETAGLSYQPLALRSTGEWRHVRQGRAGLSDDKVRAFATDEQGNLWAGTLTGGLNRLSPEFEKDHQITYFRGDSNQPGALSHGDVRAIYRDSQQRLWIATFGGGLNRFVAETQTFRNWTEADGLSNNFVYGILEDGAGMLWLSTNRGLNQFDPDQERFTHYSVQHGLQSDEFNTGAFTRNARGELFFGGVNGFNFFNPGRLEERRQRERANPPPVIMSRFSVMGQPLAWNPSRPAPVRLDYRDSFFGFEMAVLDYRDPQKNRFRYRLDGFNQDWVDNQDRPYASYTNLDAGHYQLLYEGANAAGIWSQGEPLTIIISPPFWQTTWFRLAMLLALALLAVCAWQVRKFHRAYRREQYVGRFKLLSKLGEGGSGTVYLARDPFLKRTFALKVLHPRLEDSPDGIRRFLQEAEIGSRLNHPHIVTIFEAGNHQKRRFICMEYLEGKTLKEWIEENHPLAPDRLIELACQTLAGLTAIHEQQIVHRDLKSANIMVLPDGNLKIMDFGLARLGSLTTVENRSQLMGTLAYMSPEQTLGKTVDTRSDLFSFGVILFEMRFARLPFRGENEMELIFAIHNEHPPEFNEEAIAIEPLLAVIARCMAKSPEDRFQDADSLKQALVATESPQEMTAKDSRVLPDT